MRVPEQWQLHFAVCLTDVAHNLARVVAAIDLDLLGKEGFEVGAAAP
jgi:hypothetical protein